MPQTTIALTFLTHIISTIGGVTRKPEGNHMEHDYHFRNNFIPFIEKEELFSSLKAFYFMKSDEMKLLHLVNCQVPPAQFDSTLTKAQNMLHKSFNGTTEILISNLLIFYLTQMFLKVVFKTFMYIAET